MVPEASLLKKLKSLFQNYWVYNSMGSHWDGYITIFGPYTILKNHFLYTIQKRSPAFKNILESLSQSCLVGFFIIISKMDKHLNPTIYEPALPYYLKDVTQIMVHHSKMRLGEAKHKIIVPEGIIKSTTWAQVSCRKFFLLLLQSRDINLLPHI